MVASSGLLLPFRADVHSAGVATTPHTLNWGRHAEPASLWQQYKQGFSSVQHQQAHLNVAQCYGNMHVSPVADSCNLCIIPDRINPIALQQPLWWCG